MEGSYRPQLRGQTGVLPAMSSGEQNNDTADIIRVMRDCHAAMVDARTDALARAIPKSSSK